MTTSVGGQPDTLNGISAGFWAARKRNASRRGLDFNLTTEYAWALFEQQGRKCALSGVPIFFKRGRLSNTTASLDRLDIDKGYIEGNVQWVHKRPNLMRNVLPIEEFVGWCRKVTQHV